MRIDEIKGRMTQAMRDRDQVAKNVLGLAVGELQTAEARANRALNEDEVAAVVRKLLKSNEETLSLAAGDEARAVVLRREIEVLSALLPKSMTVEEIAAALAPVADAIRAAKSDGQAMGAAMKHLKSVGANAQAPDVQQAIKGVRA
jgi:uncharacterized protein